MNNQLISDLLAIGYASKSDAQLVALSISKQTGEDYDVFQCAISYTWGIEVKKVIKEGE